MRLLEYAFSSSEKKKNVEIEILRKIRILIPTQGAVIAPPLGPTLGQFGLNIKDFCDKFNEQSKNYDSDFIVTVWITLYSNKTLSFIIKTPPLSFLINEDDESIESDFFSYYVALSTLYKVVKIKNKDLKINELSIFKSLIGTLKGMNIVLINNTFNKN
jgi:large subunit ribosomal protein L11